MTEPKLTQDEQSLQDAVESGDYGPMVPHEQRKELEAAAPHTFKKDKRINIRTPNRDLSAFQAKATKEGMPFQALASTYSDSDQNKMESLFVRTFSASEGKAPTKRPTWPWGIYRSTTCCCTCPAKR